MPKQREARRQDCGAHGPANEYHPFAFCVLVKALGEESARINLAAVMDHARKDRRATLTIPAKPKRRKGK